MKTDSSCNKTRDKIVAVSGEHFFRNGHRGTTMDELATIIGVSKKTIYVYFPTKLALLDAVMQRQFEGLYNILETTRKAHEENAVECFIAVIAKWQEILSTIQPVFWKDLQLDAATFLESTAEKRHKIIHLIFGRIIRDGAAKGYFRSDINPEMSADIIIASAEGIIRSGKCQEYQMTPKTFLLCLVRLVIEGSLTTEGRKKWENTKIPLSPIPTH